MSEAPIGKTVKVALAFPWYSGPDPHASVYFMEFMGYLARLEERSYWIAQMVQDGVEQDVIERTLTELPRLDHTGEGAEFTPDLIGTRFQFGTCQVMFVSLPGAARESVVDASLAWGADLLFWSDDDMIFPARAFLDLYRNQKDICGALAFTARPPIAPVIYKFKPKYDEELKRDVTDVDVDHDFKRDELQKVDAIGAGVKMVRADVYRKLGKPWYSSYGCGEDIFFCHRAKEHDVEVWVDTRVKTVHKATHPRWHDINAYDAERRA